MSVHSIRTSGPSAAAADNHLAQRARNAFMEPMLPALVRSAVFFAALATPFVAALLIR
jgi:hypothetical protein